MTPAREYAPDAVTVVCVTYRSRALVPELARALGLFRHVVVIDNASGDGTLEALAAELPQATLIARSSNAGFGAANNEAMRCVTTPYALLLNPDSRIDAAAVRTLVAALETFASAGVVAPQSWRGEGDPQMSFRSAFFEPKPRGRYQVPGGVCCARWLHGCCLLLRVQAFRAIGGFDERFFLYYEDDDLCLRLQQAGHECLFEPAANAQHAGGASSAPHWRTSFRKHFHYARSRHLAIRKYLGLYAGWRQIAKIALAAPLAVPVYLLLGQGAHALKWLAWGCSAWVSAARQLRGSQRTAGPTGRSKAPR